MLAGGRRRMVRDASRMPAASSCGSGDVIEPSDDASAYEEAYARYRELYPALAPDVPRHAVSR